VLGLTASASAPSASDGAWTSDGWLSNLAINILSAVILFVVGWLAWRATTRRKLADFFHTSDGITIYTSTLFVVPGGSLDFRDVRRTCGGPAVPLAESEVATRLMLVIQRFGSSALGGALKSVRFDDVDCHIAPSPARADDVSRSRTIVTLGSPGYNCVSEWVESSFDPLCRFAADMGSIDAPNGPATNVHSGMLVRACHPTTGQVAYYAAGPSELATVTAANYLVENWRKLARHYPRSMPFCLVLQADPSTGGSATVTSRTPSPTPTPWQYLLRR